MTLALQVPTLKDLTRLGPFLRDPDLRQVPMPPGRPIRFQDEAWARTLAEVLKAGFDPRVGRMYVGAEFCRFRSIDAADASAGAALLADAGMPGSLVLGPVREDRWDEALAAVEAFRRAAPDPEIVANDWGAAVFLARSGVAVELGRLLFRAKRLPRFTRVGLTPDPVPGTAVDDLVRSQVFELSRDPFGSAPEQDLMARAGLDRYQVELLPQGLRTQPGQRIGTRTLVAPWVYVTGGGRCPVEDRTVHPDGRETCAARCLATEIDTAYPDPTWPTVGIGNSVFMLGVPVLAHFLALDRMDRVLLEPWVAF